MGGRPGFGIDMLFLLLQHGHPCEAAKQVLGKQVVLLNVDHVPSMLHSSSHCANSLAGGVKGRALDLNPVNREVLVGS